MKSEEVKPSYKEEPIVVKPKRKCKPKVIEVESEPPKPAKADIEKAVAPIVKPDSINIPVNGAKSIIDKELDHPVLKEKTSSKIPVAQPILVKPSADGGAR